MNNYFKLPTEDKRMVLQQGTWTRHQRLAKYLFLGKRFFREIELGFEERILWAGRLFRHQP